MCAPSSDAGAFPEGLEERISKLEEMLANGVKPAAAAPVKAPDPEPVRTPAESAKPEPIKEEPKPEFREPENAPEPPPLPSSPVQQPEIPDGPFTNWADVLEKIRIYDIPLFGIMANTTASIKNGRVVICSDNSTLFDFICSDTHSKDLARAVYEVLGRRMKIAVSTPEKAKAEKNPLEDLKNKINKFNNN